MQKKRAAIVTAVPEGPRDSDEEMCVSLAVLNPMGLFFDLAVPYSDPYEMPPVGGTWHWPERV